MIDKPVTQMVPISGPNLKGRLAKFETEFEMFMHFLWCRQDPFAQELDDGNDKVYGVPINFNFMIPETVMFK